MNGSRLSFRLTPVALALLLSGCSMLPSFPWGEKDQEAASGASARQRASADAAVPTQSAEYVGSSQAADAARAEEAREQAATRQEALQQQSLAADIKLAGNFCEDTRRITRDANRYLKREALTLPPAQLSMTQAQCAAKTFLKRLIPSAGRIVGYKYDAVSQSVADGVDGTSSEQVPVRGNILARMILPSGVAVSTKRSAIHLRMEADLVAVVRSSTIHDAQTPREALASLKAFIPMVELPDLAYQNPDQQNAAAATYVNGNARFFVLGKPIPVTVDQSMVDQLGAMTVTMTDRNGRTLSSVPGSSMAGNPLNAVLAQVQALEKAGIRLRPGDMLSLGAFGERQKPEAGNSYRVNYDGLPGNPGVVVNFR